MPLPCKKLETSDQFERTDLGNELACMKLDKEAATDSISFHRFHWALVLKKFKGPKRHFTCPTFLVSLGNLYDVPSNIALHASQINTDWTLGPHLERWKINTRTPQPLLARPQA